MHIILSLFCIVFLINNISADCQNGTIQGNNKAYCYKVFNESTTWGLAQLNCSSIGGNLARVDSSFTNAFLLQTAQANFPVPGNVWLGGTVINKKLGWSDGYNATYTNWATGRPNTLNAMDALLMRIPNGEWYNENRFEQNPYICELPITHLPCCPTNWTYFEPVNKCLRILPNNVNWWGGTRGGCIYAGGDLTSIHSDDEEFIASVLALSSLTDYPITLNIGLNNANSNNTWGWSDGTLMDYVKWAPNYPNYPQGNHYVTLVVDPDPANNGWANVNDHDGHAICQTDSFC